MTFGYFLRLLAVLIFLVLDKKICMSDSKEILLHEDSNNKKRDVWIHNVSRYPYITKSYVDYSAERASSQCRLFQPASGLSVNVLHFRKCI